MELQTAKWKVNIRTIVWAKMLNSILAVLTGGAFFDKNPYLGVTLMCLYAACKTFAENVKPVENEESTNEALKSIVPNPFANGTTNPNA